MELKEAIEHAREIANKEKSKLLKVRDKYECTKYSEEHEQLAGWLEELKEYKELEEQGLFEKLPCKVGDTIWIVDEREREYNGYLFMANCGEYVIVAVEYFHCAGDFGRQLLEMVDESYDNFGVDVEIFHKNNVYSTKEEAEKAIKQMEEN